MGARLAATAAGIAFSSSICGILHYYTRGYVVTFRTHKCMTLM